MPERTEDEIKQLIADNSIFAIAIDTAVVDGLQGNLESTLLKSLNQFETREIRVLFSEVVAGEIKRHLSDAARDSGRALKKAIWKHCKLWKLSFPDGIEDTLGLHANADELAAKSFEEFLKSIHGEVAPATKMSGLPEEVLRRYFSDSPPFGQSEKRKHEFPDAFALLTLEAVAKKEKRLLLCISPDKGWQDFCAASDHMVCVGDLEKALSYFNAAYQAVAEQIVAAWRESTGGDFLELIDQAFEYRFSDLDFVPTGDAVCDFEAEPVEAVMQYVDLQTISEPTPIAADGDSITFTVRVEAVVAFTAEFNFYAYDSLDRHSVFLSSEQSSVEERIPFELTVTAERPLKGEPVFSEVQVATGRFEVDFGHVEPFPNENPEHEKY